MRYIEIVRMNNELTRQEDLTMENPSGKIIRAKNANSNFGKRGWAIIILGMVMYFCSAGIIVEGSNMIVPAVAGATGMSEAGLFSMATVASLICIPLAFLYGMLITRFGPRKIMALSWFGGAVGLVITAYANNYVVYTIGRVLIALASTGGITMAYNALVANWFPTKKDLVQGYATIGSNLSTAFAVMIISALIARLSLRGMFFVSAAVFLLLAIASLVGYKDNPEEADCYPDNDQSMTKERVLALLREGEEYQKTSPWTVKKLLATKQTWQISIGYGIILLITVGILSTFVTTLAIKGLAINTAISLMTVAAVVAIPCSYLWGYMGAKLGTKAATIILYGVVLVCILFMLIPGSWTAYVAVAFLGCFIGAGNNLTPSIVGSVFGRYDFSRAMAVIIPIWSIIVSLATTIVGVPQSLTGSYALSYIILAVLAVVGIILVATLDERCIGRSDL